MSIQDDRNAYLAKLISDYDLNDPQSATLTWNVLKPILESVARQIVKRHPASRDFIEDIAVDLLAPRSQEKPPLITTFDSNRGVKVLTWLWRVIQNKWITQLRQLKSKSGQVPYNEDHLRQLRINWSALTMKFGEDFSAEEMAVLERWNVRERLEVITIAGLEHRVPRDIFERYLLAYETEVNIKLKRPFPPSLVGEECSPRGRIGPLATLLGISSNTLSKRWERGRVRLHELSSIRELFPAVDDGTGDCS
jgi:DNA-directed RNA polymerase specialized sigma24 family protein